VTTEIPSEMPDAFEQALAETAQARFVLQLYVTGSTTQCLRALANLKSICEEHLAGRYDLEVIDIYQEPDRARAAQIFAVPTLIKRLPEPLRRFIGDLSDRDRVLSGLNLPPKANGL
jgi:circadian clock protein KaiB